MERRKVTGVRVERQLGPAVLSGGVFFRTISPHTI
jgi:hypothetical protein